MQGSGAVANATSHTISRLTTTSLSPLQASASVVHTRAYIQTLTATLMASPPPHRQGEWFGEIALLEEGEQGRTATATATGGEKGTTLLQLDRDGFDR